MTWEPAFLLPNIRLEESIETEIVILAAPNDPKIEAIKNEHRNFSEYVTKFTDQFEVPVAPAVLLVHSDAPKSFKNLDAVASFRDVIAIASICGQRAKTLAHDRAFHPQYTDWYDFYPWMLTVDFEYLTCQTPGFWGLHVVEEFKGQSSPSLTPVTIGRRDFDKPLLSKLLAEWEVRYSTEEPTWRSTALFRSLNMAVSAAKMPGSRDVTIFSVGRSLSLWVSAFEILVHPNEGKSGYKLVYELLSSVDLTHEQCRAQYVAFPYKEGQFENLLCWIYGEINRVRNDFLHGNPVTSESLKEKTSGRSFYEFAAVLYRLALTGFLPLSNLPNPELVFDRNHFDFLSAQRDAETAIRKILVVDGV